MPKIRNEEDYLFHQLLKYNQKYDSEQVRI